MKKLNFLFVILLSILLTSSCDKEEQGEGDQESKGSISLSYSISPVKGELISKSSEESAPKAIIISIKNSKEEFVLNMSKLTLIKFGDGYCTEHVELAVGDYTIEDFLVLDANDSVIYLTPKIGSEFEKFVPHPLPISFSVTADFTTKVILDVISSHLGCAEQFGYAVFSFNILNSLIIQPDSVAGKDAVFGKIVPDNNYGDIQDIHLYAWTQGGILNVNRVAIDFGLSIIPEGVVIDSAFLSLYFNSTSVYLEAIPVDGHYGDNSFVIDKITEPWEENSITWNNQPSVSSEYQVYVEDTEDITSDFENIDISDIIIDSYKNPDSSFGLMLRHNVEEPYKVTFIASSDHPDKSKRPKLTIFYH